MGVSQSTTTLILSYLYRALGLERARLRNVLQHSQGIYLLTYTYRPGILVQIPNGTANMLTRLGNQTVAAVIPFAAKAFGDDARAVCQLVYDNILRHLVDGMDLPIPLAAISGTRSLGSLSLLEALGPVKRQRSNFRKHTQSFTYTICPPSNAAPHSPVANWYYNNIPSSRMFAMDDGQHRCSQL
ncbi:hypothetical protein OIDMADRAFT_27443 [Oidiodendron maius Zn]|uniref:Uncharacterized protein n=1 Tax=Oidiodendron maius (strain Zn) TaxID=913774 RepID=A0A0C3DLQ9_OIDMZ|nr:hypothetical protein OIDMADRAFT_27443 [Oidiodendron maius Zn]